VGDGLGEPFTTAFGPIPWFDTRGADVSNGLTLREIAGFAGFDCFAACVKRKDGCQA
jgi:hypothetical protein